MHSTEVYRLLARRPRRGRVIFGALAAGLCVCAALFSVSGRGAWAIAAVLGSLLLGLGFWHVSERALSARSVAENPQIVFWAHPTAIPAHNVWLFAFTPLQFLTLHLRDGRQFEAGLPPNEMCAFISWLTARNPEVRVGAYDSTNAA